MLRVMCQLLGPGRVARGLDVVLDQQSAEQNAHSDVGEGAESEQLPRGVDELCNPRVLLLELLDDRAERLLAERGGGGARGGRARGSRGDWPSSATLGSCCWSSSTIEPIGSSTSGIQSSASAAT